MPMWWRFWKKGNKVGRPNIITLTLEFNQPADVVVLVAVMNNAKLSAARFPRRQAV